MPDSNPTSQKTLQHSLTWLIVLFVLALAIADLMLPQGVAVGFGYVVPVVFSFGYRDTRATWRVALLGVALTALGYYLSPEGNLTWMVLTNRVSSILAIMLCAWMGMIAERERAQRDDLLVQNSEVERARTAAERLFDSITSILIEVDGERRITRWNQAAADAFGLQASEVLGHDLAICGIAWDESDLGTLITDLEQSIKVTGLEMRFEHPTTGARVIGASLSRLTNSGAGSEGTLLLARDITQEANRKQIQKRLITAVEQVDETIVITDLDGKILYVNPAFSRVTGYTRREALGLNPSALNSGAHDADFYQDLWGTLQRGEVWTGHFTNRRKDGSLYEEDATISPVRSEEGKITHFVAVKRDVTERLAIEMQLRTAQRLESIGQLAAGIAHEINTPAQFISDNTRFLKDSFDTVTPLLELCVAICDESRPASEREAKSKELGSTVRNAQLDFILEEIPGAIMESLDGLSRVTEIVSAMKSFSHPGVKEKQPVDINEVIGTTITLSTNEWKYVAKIDTHLDADLPLVEALPGELGQVILNMIVNASHAIAECSASEAGTIRIATSFDEERGEVCISIGDSGCGIEKEVIERVFDPFFTTKEVGKGTGQGLALSHSVIVDKHDGRISLQSELGVGTTFFIHLPVTAPSDEEHEESCTAFSDVHEE